MNWSTDSAKKILAYCLLFKGFFLSGKILIITHAFNRPDFIEIQQATFKKFMKDDYEFVVFNDAQDSYSNEKINSTCEKYGIQSIKIPQEIHTLPYLKRFSGESYPNPCTRCADAVQYSLDVLGFKHNDIVMIIDSDMFLIKDFSVKAYLFGYDLAGLIQTRGQVRYLWNGLVFLNMRTLPEKETINFNCGFVDKNNVDVGGFTYYYLQKFNGQNNNPEARLRYIDHLPSGYILCPSCRKANNYHCQHHTTQLELAGFDKYTIDFIQKGPAYIEFMLNHTFLHYRAGGNWMHESPEFHKHKTKLLNDFMSGLLKS